MGNNNFKIFIIFGGFLLITLFLASGYFSFKAYTASKKMKYDFRTLQKKVARLTFSQKRIENRMENIQTTVLSKYRNSPASDFAKNKDLMHLKKIVKATGLEQLAGMEKIDPEIFQGIYKEYHQQKQIDEYRDELEKRNKEQLQADKERYNEELGELYQRARYHKHDPPGNEEKDQAFEELLLKYPEAYTTAMAISERAFVAVFRRNTEAVEKYYDLLVTGNNNDALGVTVHGFEALPNIEHYLVRQYINNGRNEKAEQLIDSLENNYKDSRIFTMKPGKGPKFSSVSEMVAGLREDNQK